MDDHAQGRRPARGGAHLNAPSPTLGLSADAEQVERAAAIETGRLLFAAPARFETAAQTIDQLPAPDRPEVALAGRSNVGKSSLLNAISGHNALARVSNTPGRTRQLNFFDIAGRLTLVDMPGYGYAEAPRSVKDAWQGTMFDFLRGRPTLRRVLLLIDARVGFKPADVAAMKLLDQAAVAFQIVLTKADKLKPPALVAIGAEARVQARAHTAAHPDVIETSSETGLGIEALRAEIATFALP